MVSDVYTSKVVTFEQFRKALEESYTAALLLLKKMEQIEAREDNTIFISVEAERERLLQSVISLDASLATFNKIVNKEIERRSKRYRMLIDRLKRSMGSVASDNYLLQYKKRDLLNVTNELEEAYEEITIKNKELTEQKELISRQSEELREAQKKLLEANSALELQKESLMDQADYLHEATITITQMHEEVHEQKQEIEKKNEELQTLNQEKNSLIGIVAHDLKSPLNQMKGLLSLMMETHKDHLNDDSKLLLSMIESSADHMTKMITKILDVEAVEAKNMNLAMVTLNVSTLLEQVSQRFVQEATAKEIALHFDIEKELFVEADASYLDQVFQNLISNAVKFSPAGKNIFIKLFARELKVICEVKDEGPGLTEDDQKKLFGKYQKLSARPTGNESSTGLGLSIVKKFVEAMHAKIWCESNKGEGASFFVEFDSKKS